METNIIYIVWAISLIVVFVIGLIVGLRVRARVTEIEAPHIVPVRQNEKKNGRKARMA